MSTDYAAKERAFLDSLEADTGRDLAGWMQAIGAAGLPHRNDTIDWLRQQGFPFSRASWLERIHHNGGRPIYADAAPRPAATRRTPARARATASEAASAASNGAPPAAAPPAPSTAGARVPSLAPPRQPAPDNVVPLRQPAAASAEGAPLGKAAVSDLLAPAKAYRMLAQYLIGAVEKAIPAVTIRAADGLLILAAPEPFAAILASPRDIRLGLDVGEADLGPHVLRSRLPGAPAEFAHTVVLDDARQVNPELITLVEAASRRAKARSG